MKLKELIEQYKDCSNCMKKSNYPQEWLDDIVKRQKEVFANYSTKSDRQVEITKIHDEYRAKFDDEIGEVKIPYEGKLLTLDEANELLESKNTPDKPEYDSKVFVGKRKRIKALKISNKANNPVTVGDVTYNGGSSSASSISGAIQLAKLLGEDSVKIWDINNVVRTYSFEDALALSKEIGKIYRDAKYHEYETIENIQTCTTIEELEAIKI